jgi:steroid delta-isomerase-like uncharacterized protein
LPVSTEENKEVVRRVGVEPWEGNLSVVDELVSTNYVGHDPTTPDHLGPSAVKEFVSGYLAAFPDASITIEEQLAEGDLVATRWTASGTHKGDLMGIAPTGKQVTVTGITISRVEGGQLVEEWSNWDTLGLLQQLGAIPQLAGAQA